MNKLSYLFFSIICVATNASSHSMTYLNFTVHNSSSTPIAFKSPDLFDFGKVVHQNETKTITYDFAPKIITMSILNPDKEPYNIIIDESCDSLGWPKFRQVTFIGDEEEVEGVAKYKAGNIRINISDVSEANEDVKHFSCTKSVTQDADGF